MRTKPQQKEKQNMTRKSIVKSPMVIKHMIQELTQKEDEKDSMVLNFAVSTKEIGVREQKFYFDFNKPEECKQKLRNALIVRNYANRLANLTEKEIESALEHPETN